ncbi:MAG: archease [Desulfurococcales archaeon]|nr:archease [Desulfurococcales archaeon]
MECPGYEHMEHTADELVVGRGRTLEEAFEMAAIGVYEVMTDTAKVRPERRVDIEVEGMDLENLLYRWIEELLIATDAEGLVFSIAKVCRIDETGDGYKLVGSAWGEPFDPERHEHRTIVKAMTYAQMEIKREDSCWRVQFVVDI